MTGVLQDVKEEILDALCNGLDFEGSNFRELADANLTYEGQANAEGGKKAPRGDFALPVFKFTELYGGMKPVEVAEMFETSIELPEHIKLKRFGPFLNFLIDEDHFHEKTLEEVLAQKENYGRSGRVENEKPVIVEYCSPNFGKVLHVGHIRSLLVGEAVSKILDAAGHDVIRMNYPGDIGGHMGKVLAGLHEWEDGDLPSDPFEAQRIMGEVYVRFGTEALDWRKLLDKEYVTLMGDEDGGFPKERRSKAANLFEDILEGEPDLSFLEAAEQKVVKNLFDKYSVKQRIRSKDLNEKATQLNLALEEGNEEVISLWRKICQASIIAHGATYERLGVNFDHIRPPSGAMERGKLLANEALEKKLAVIHDGAISISLGGDFGNQKLLGADGNAVYATLDLGEAVARIETFDLGRMIYVVGFEQEAYFNKVFETLRRLGYGVADHCEHLKTGHLTLADGKMSSRLGNVLLLDDVLETAVERAANVIREKHKDSPKDLSEEQIAEMAEKIGLGALKYVVLSKDPYTGIKYDEDTALAFEGKTGPFAQYAYVRASSILQNIPASELELAFEHSPRYEDESSQRLVRKIAEFPLIVQNAASSLKPSIITEYAHGLGRAFNRFYHDTKVSSETDQQDKLSSIKLIEGFRHTMSNTLGLLGVETLERM